MNESFYKIVESHPMTAAGKETVDLLNDEILYEEKEETKWQSM